MTVNGAQVIAAMGGAPAGIDPTVLAAFAAGTFAEPRLDSREVQPGDLFVAVPGAVADGRDFVDAALANGAIGALVEADGYHPAAVAAAAPVVAVAGLRDHLGALARLAYPLPPAPLKLWGVTGTNGKTTVAWLLAQLLSLGGQRCGFLGTLGAGFPQAADGDDSVPASAAGLVGFGLTTGDVFANHRQVAQLVDQGARAIAMEVSSHALDQGRVDGLDFYGVAFTNLSRDHLDYHGDMAAYGVAKARLMARPEIKHRLINADDTFGRSLRTSDGRDRLYCRNAGTVPGQLASWRDIRLARTGSRGVLVADDRCLALRVSLLGDFNLDNLALAVIAARCSGITDRALTVAAPRLQAAPGRLQQFALPDDVLGVVDYAHTPDALARALAAVRAVTPGRLICVFGCGGDRDTGKRAPMGAAAAHGADAVILTNDNPRSETPEAIVEDILAGWEESTARQRVIVALDRRAAIVQAVAMAASGDSVLVAGKGHEAEQVLATGAVPFSDIECLAELALDDAEGPS